MKSNVNVINHVKCNVDDNKKEHCKTAINFAKPHWLDLEQENKKSFIDLEFTLEK